MDRAAAERFAEAAYTALEDDPPEWLSSPPRGHQAGPVERARAYARYQRIREARFGAVPEREQLGAGVRNSLAGESPLIRKLFGGSVD